jgi:hypothetical protein
MNRKCLLDASYMIRSSHVTVLTSNNISVELKIFHIVIQDL